ncbi:hypothetical protein D9M72_553550 [compost metagenome]
MLLDKDWRRLVDRRRDFGVARPPEGWEVQGIRIYGPDLVDRQRVALFRVGDLRRLPDMRREPRLLDVYLGSSNGEQAELCLVVHVFEDLVFVLEAIE